MAPSPSLLRRATGHLRRADPALARIIRAVGPCRPQKLDRRGGPFAALVEAILYQQLNGKAAATIHTRLCQLTGGRRPRPEDFERLSDPDLRGVGLSRQKISYMRDLGARVRDGLPLARLGRLSDERVIEALTTVKGIGRWTAEMFLIVRLGRMDVLAVDDYGLRQAIRKAYRMRSLPKPDRMRRLAEPWRPYRTVASWYLWRSLERPGGRA